MTPGGRAILATRQFDGVSDVIEVAERAGPKADWNPTRRLSPFGTTSNSPRAAIDQSGAAIVVWTLSTSEFFSVVQAAVRLGPNAPWSQPLQVSPQGEWASGGEVAFDGQGQATVVWSNNTHEIVQGRTWIAPTNTWTESEQISTDTPWSGPLIAVSPSGRAIVAWSAHRGFDYVVHASIRPSRGAAWGPEQALSTQGNASVSDIVIDPSGQAIVMWDRFLSTIDYLEVATLPAGSLVWGPPETLSSPGTSGHNGKVDIASDGTAFAAWQRDVQLQQVGIDASIRGPTDSEWSTAEPIAEHAFVPMLAATSTGDAVVAFGQVAWWTTIKARVRDAGTGSWGPVSKLSTPAFEASPNSLGVDGFGRAFLAWQTLSEQCRCFRIQGADYFGSR